MRFKQIRPNLASVYERQYNKPFPNKENYFPIKYDSEKNTFDIKEMRFNFDVTKTNDGFTIERENNVKKVLDINIFEVFARAVKEQVYYTEVQPALEVVKSVVNSHKYQSKTGNSVNEFWKTFIQDVSVNGNTGGTLDYLRGNFSTAILGYKLSTIVIQPLAVIDAMSTVSKEFGMKKAHELVPMVLKMGVSPKTLKDVVDSSLVLRDRKGGQTEIAELRDLSKGELSDNKFRRFWGAYKKKCL